MYFKVYNDISKPAALLVPAMFCNEELFGSMIEYLSDFHVIVPVLDGQSSDDTVFSSVNVQSDKILDYLKKRGISELDFICGMSLGAIIALDIFRSNEISIKRAIFDGGPFFDFGKTIKWFMSKVFWLVCYTDKKNPELMKKLLLKKIPYLANKKTVNMVNSICGQMNKESINNLTIACYSFNSPELSKDLQKKAVFIYGSKEPAFKSMAKLQERYTDATFIVKKEYHHLEYQATHTIEFVKLLTGMGLTIT